MQRIIREAESAVARKRNGWIALALLAFVVAALGGSSRPDAVQIAALRPVAALFLIPAFYYFSRSNLGAMRVPVILFGLLCALMALQLVPLPAGVWQSLPGRAAVVALGEASGMQDIWRPISLVPARTMNALASLVVPAAALLLIVALAATRTQMLLTVAALGLVNAIAAILQAVSGGNEALYPYAITNMGTPVGIFANQNHSAVFGAVSLLTIGYLLAASETRHWHRWQRGGLIAAFMIVMLAALTGGSRAGLLATFLAVLSCGTMFWLAFAGDRRNRHAMPQILGRPIRPSLLVGGALALVAAIIALFVMFDRVPALQTLTDAGSFEDLRWRLLPSLQAMIGQYWLTGAGFGSFEEAYHIVEPTALLEQVYVNQAHNDWAQLLIEGGLAAVLLCAVFAGWVIARLIAIGGESRAALVAVLFFVTLAAIILFASLVDYPLRTPIFQFVAMLWIGVLALSGQAREKAGRARG